MTDAPNNQLEQYVAKRYLKDLEDAGGIELKGSEDDIVGALSMMAHANQMQMRPNLKQQYRQLQDNYLTNLQQKRRKLSGW